MSMFILYNEFLFVRFVVLPLYITRGGSVQINVPCSAVAVKRNEMTVKPAPDFFNLGLQTKWNWEHPYSVDRQMKGNKNAGAKQMPKPCLKKPGDKSIQSWESWAGWAVPLERRGSKKPHPFLQDLNASTESQTEWFWLLSHSRGQGNTRSLASSQRLCN